MVHHVQSVYRTVEGESLTSPTACLSGRVSLVVYLSTLSAADLWMGERWNGKDLEGRGDGLTDVL
jgi:hypothetical protein